MKRKEIESLCGHTGVVTLMWSFLFNFINNPKGNIMATVEKDSIIRFRVQSTLRNKFQQKHKSNRTQSKVLRALLAAYLENKIDPKVLSYSQTITVIEKV